MCAGRSATKKMSTTAMQLRSAIKEAEDRFECLDEMEIKVGGLDCVGDNY